MKSTSFWYLPIVILALTYIKMSSCQASISLASTAYFAREGEQIAVQVQKSGVAATDVNVVIQLENSVTDDFVGSSAATVFSAGINNATRNVIFTITDDILPEPDETFYITLEVTNGHGIIGSPNTGQITVVANDEAFGVFSFSNVNDLAIEELTTGENVLQLNIRRQGGFKEQVVVSFEVTQITSLAGTQSQTDIEPASGNVTFYDGETVKPVTLRVVDDWLPEQDEIFRLELVSAEGGYSVAPSGNRPHIDSTRSSVQLTIPANDAPVRFQQELYRVDEQSFQSTLTLVILRGEGPHGNITGPVTRLAAVDYYIRSITAENGVDFVLSNGTLSFAPGTSRAMLNVDVLSDDVAEMAESFEVILSDITGDAVLQEPGIATIIINANDDSNGVLSFRADGDQRPVVRVSEEVGDSTAAFVLTRGGGAFGELSIQWILTFQDGSLVEQANHVTPITGVVVFPDGIREQTIAVSILQDTVAEPAQRYTIALLPDTVEGGGRAEGILTAELIVEDSDLAHGVIQFTDDRAQSIVTLASPRRLSLTLVRSGGTLGDVNVYYTAAYMHPTSNSSQTVFANHFPDATTIPSGEASHTFEVHIRSEAFLQVDGYFQIVIISVELSGDSSVGPYNTPSLGSKQLATLPVTDDVANGEIGFVSIERRHIQEPEDGSSVVSLAIERVGTSGEVTIYWILRGTGIYADHVTDTDIQPMGGVLSMTSGQSSASIELEILADDLAETEEAITVTLTRVEPAAMQRFLPVASEVVLVIQENDNAGGTFHFDASMSLSYHVREELDPIEIHVMRTGGALVVREIEYYIEPNGDREFYGATNVMRFEPGDAHKTATILAKLDGVPELAEDFRLRLRSFGSGAEAVIGSRNTVNITVAENEHPYGKFEFEPETEVYVGESTANSSIYALVPVQRTQGRFATVTVDWYLDSNFTADLSPQSGTLYFEPGVGERYIEILTVADDLPEAEESFAVTLRDATNGAALGDTLTALVHSLSNDDAVYFSEGAAIAATEGESITLTIIRDGNATQPASVKYRTVDGTATLRGFDFSPLEGVEVLFEVGEIEKQFEVEVLQDETPETDELFYVQLYDPIGDIAVYKIPEATIVIEANDQANGIFSFALPLDIEGSEGDFLPLSITRSAGHFSVVHVYWDIRDDVTGLPLLDGDEFSNTSGVVVFSDLQTTADLVLMPVADGVPEYSEVFSVALIQVAGGGPSGEVPLLANDNLQASVTIRENDDPFGVFTFTESSRELSIAEDYVEGRENTTEARLAVERLQGTFNTVKVVWEAFSYQIAGAGSLPPLIDLLLVATPGAGVEELPWLRRAGTGTDVFGLDGCEECYMEIPPQYQPLASDIRDGFAISVWLQALRGGNGYVLAKTSPDAQRHYYALHVSSDSAQGSASLEFRYSVPDNQNNQVVARAVNVNLEDNFWHHVTLNVQDGVATFFVDGRDVGSSALEGNEVLDEDGILYVGAMAGPRDMFEGVLQDLRMFSRHLHVGEIREIYESPSRQDITPVSGYLTFHEGESMGEILIESKDETEEEANDVFAVKLLAATGARIDDDNAAAVLTVLKSDNANGLFSFADTCTPILGDHENSSFTCVIQRERGDSDTVYVNWLVLDLQTGEPAEEDFVNVSGVIEFAPGEREKILTVTAYDDDLPEISEDFSITLASVSSADGTEGSTPTSGASLKPGASASNVTLDESDYPYGLLEFSLDVNPPMPDGLRISPAFEQPVIEIDEETGTLVLVVVRAQGMLGRVSVEWRTRDGTAQSFGNSYPDYVANVDRLTFEPYERYKFINITILDNLIPESSKYFEVQLLNPTDGAEVGLGSIIRVEIRHSDFAHGVFGFHKNSMLVEASETMEMGLNLARFSLIREGGTIDAVNVTWRVTSDPDNDLVTREGVTTFADGQSEIEVVVDVRQDTVPELDEIFLIIITHATKGIVGAAQSAQLVILGNDDPYGLFVVSSRNRPIYAEEDDEFVTITIERGPTSGHYGEVTVSYTTLSPSESYSFLPGTLSRANEQDYNHTAGSVTFAPGIRSMTFNVTLLHDDAAEVEESVFVVLTAVQLLDAEQQQYVADSPRLGPSIETYAQIIIEENDDPHGVLELSVARVTVEEGHRGPFVTVIRRAGTFGTVSVKFEVVQGTATYGLDYTVTSTDVVFGSGETEKPVPIEIIDDALPEMQERFIIRLVDQISGDARLGTRQETAVTIQLSDDPHGAFGFESSTGITTEPGLAGGRTVSIPVVRLGGTLGVVAVEWTAHNEGNNTLTEDVSPASGTVHFVSNSARENIIVNIVPDEFPEGIENIQLTLTSVSNGGALLEDRATFTLTILANDNPHGTVQFAENIYTLEEPTENTLQYVSVTRLGGHFGQLRVYYSIQELDLLAEIAESGETVYEYYEEPVNGKPLPLVGTQWDVRSQEDPRTVCASFCLLSPSCEAFDYNANRVDCNWFTTTQYDRLDDRTGYVFYMKRLDMSNALYSSKASVSIDFTTVQRQALIMEDGATESLLPVQIIPDTHPELPERFRVSLLEIELIGDIPSDPDNIPELGDNTHAEVVISSNDAAHGVFHIYSSEITALDEGRRVEVGERERLAVELVVERRGGSIGTVAVSWRVVDDVTTASRGADYTADGATLIFEPGVTQRIITIGIEDDSLPENDEVVEIELYNPEGGAVLSSSQGSRATVLIMANDHVAGLLAFERSSYLVREGDVVSVRVTRSAPALGRVTVEWLIQALDSQPAEQRFRLYTGTLFFDVGDMEEQIVLHVLVDNDPKINQEYHVMLTDVFTEGVRQTGAAALHSDHAVAVVTLEGGNEPHGVFSVSLTALQTRATEENGTVHVPVDRKFGAIGAVRLSYEVKPGSLVPVGELVEAALPDDDFVALTSDIIIYDGESAATIPVDILDDSIPEIDEVFLLQLLSVQLLNPDHSTFSPRLANSGTTAEVIINANDGTQGEVVFAEQYANVTVEEGRHDVTLILHRTQGTFGSVSVFCFAQNTRGGAVRGEDFNFDPREVYFGQGISEQIIVIEILEDTHPEPDEVFEIILASPKNGLTIGFPGKATITISASDEASGVVSFASAANVSVVEPSDNSEGGNSLAQLTLVRAPGAFGEIRVPFEIQSSNGGDVTDLSPPQGVVIFQDQQETAILEISVVADDIPEEAEVFIVLLQPPDGGATLGDIIRKTIIVDRNDAPYGLLEIYPSGMRNSSIAIEESRDTLYFDVIRRSGSLDWITVDLVTSPITARSQTGNELHVGLLHKLSTLNTGNWCAFSAHGWQFALFLRPSAADIGSRDSELFLWQGTLMHRQTLRTDAATSCTSFSIQENTYVVITNQGEEFRRDTVTQLYLVSTDAQLEMIQELNTKGAKSASVYSHESRHFLFVANGLNSIGDTDIASYIYEWNSDTARFGSTPVQFLQTTGAVTTTIIDIDENLYLLTLNHYDSSLESYEIKSVLYQLDSNSIWNVHQHFQTKGAISATVFTSGSSVFLAVANNRDDVGNYQQNVNIYVWNAVTVQFEMVQNIPTVDVRTVEAVTYEQTVFLAIACQGSQSTMHKWDEDHGQFVQLWTGPRATSLIPLATSNAIRDDTPEVILLLSELNNNSIAIGSNVYQMALLGVSDYIPRHSTLWFAPGQQELQVAVSMVDDNHPEGTEQFSVELTNARRGAELGANHVVIVNILTNDNGHGVISFAPDSLEKYVEELPGQDNSVTLHVMREAGGHGHVIVAWRMSGEHNGIYDIDPVEGIVEFADGQSAATIVLSIADDGLPELDEDSFITLTQILDDGSEETRGGAILGNNIIAKVVVMANDSPYGVVAWEMLNYVTHEPEGSDITRSLRIVREQGTLGDISVSYMTRRAASFPEEEQATSGRDYVATQSTVELAGGVTAVDVHVPILADADPEIAESFLVNITSVQLLGASPELGAGPSVSAPRRLATVTVLENDNARGLVQFAVVRNAENRIDSYEGVESIQLTVGRSVGYFGQIEASWQAVPREATLDDFTPPGGLVIFEEGQLETTIEIQVINDDIPENLETFDVELTRVTSGGAALGSDNSVRIGILKNDSPNGVFSFIDTEKSVRESSNNVDPAGLVSMDVVRRGTDGEVTVQWRLSADALHDFLPPLAGSVLFTAGDTRKTIAMRTKPDDILEGTEHFTLSLVSANNNGDISPSNSDATITILPDTGASGVVRVSVDTQTVYIGEPTAGYDGTAVVELDRGVGIYGEVVVTWQILPRDVTSFTQTQGVASFSDLQKHSSILLQTKDDSDPESRTTFTLELTSATNGATLAQDLSSAHIVYGANDYPHGLFEFSQPAEMTVREEQTQVSVTVTRQYGHTGEAVVYYTTSAGTASDIGHSNQDFRPTSGTLRFQDGQTEGVLLVDIIDDDASEGPEYFFVNLTDVHLAFPDINNYTLINGVQLDIAPALGPLAVKTVIIGKNDNAEGTVQFSSDALTLTVQEESGIAEIPIVRHPGTFETISVTFTIQDGTAVENLDFTVPSFEAQILDGDSEGVLSVVIIDDSDREFEEDFTVVLTAVSNGAELGQRTTARVTIAKSDYPNGKLSFLQEMPLTLPNPQTSVVVPVTVARTGGAIGRQTLLWRIMGPNNENRVLAETNDIAYLDNSGQERTQGQLEWDEGELGSKSFSLHIKPYSGWEVGESFVVTASDIHGFPADQGSAEIDPAAHNFTIVIEKHGDPSGIVRFDGLAQVKRDIQEPQFGYTTVIFPLLRREGTTGEIQIHWHIQSLHLDPNYPDIEATFGVASIQTGRRDGQIAVQVLADDIPELNETFRIVLIRAEGGADIDTQFNTSEFNIRYNDAPHGRFSINSTLQTVVVSPSDLKRRLRLNITREGGTVGRVRISFRMRFDQAVSGVSYIPSSGSVIVNNSQSYAVVHVNLEPDVFLPRGSTFTVTLTAASFIGVDVTEPPELVSGQTIATVRLPDDAANSQVGFEATIVTVEEDTNLAEITLLRHGSYGNLQVLWRSGLPTTEVPAGFVQGAVLPGTDVVRMNHGQSRIRFFVQISPETDQLSLFALHLPEDPVSNVGGGAELETGRTTCRIDPYGVLEFRVSSRNKVIEESSTDDVQVTLTVERRYGVQGSIQVRYTTHSGIALADVDFAHVASGAVTMANTQTSAEIYITIRADDIPETNEHFYVNLTDVTLLPTDLSQQMSPRVSDAYDVAMVTISINSDPYGVISIVASNGGVVSEPGSITLTLERTKGTFGDVHIQVRTVGGGEPWDSAVGTAPSNHGNTSNTIGQALANRDLTKQAAVDIDYDMLDTTVVLLDGESVTSVTLYVHDDTAPEDTESVFIYITTLTEGVRVASPNVDDGRKGFAEVHIERNDYWSGWLGFYSVNSSTVVAEEDAQLPAVLTVERRNASFGTVQIFWRAVLQPGSDEIHNNNVDLSQELPTISNKADCTSNERFCKFEIPLLQDIKPENETTFYVELTRVSSGADIDPQRKYAAVTMLQSDDPNGKVQFRADSRLVYANKRASFVTLQVERIGYLGKMVYVEYETVAYADRQIVAGVSVANAIAGRDFQSVIASINFLPGENMKTVEIPLDLSTVSLNPYPKAFRVLLKSANNGAVLEHNGSVVTVVDDDEVEVWQTWAQAQGQLNNATIDSLMTELQTAIGTSVSDNDLAITMDILDTVIDVAQSVPLLEGTRGSIMDVFCKLLEGSSTDATRGHWRLSQQLERFAFTYLHQYPCDTCCTQPDEFLQSPQCRHVSFHVAKWYPDDINGYRHNVGNQDYIRIPEDYLNLQNGRNSDNPACFPLVFLQYTSQQWFDMDRNKELLNEKVISVVVFGEGSRKIDTPVKFKIHSDDSAIPSQSSKCVYFNEDSGDWTRDRCRVTNNLDLVVDDYVECSCKHMSSYAVLSEIRDPNKIGYPIWFHVSIFICLSALAVVIVCHHFCAFHSMFSANLLMHMCFSVFATELCYLVDAYLSPDHILDLAKGESNYRCIVMSLFLHYFYIAQFTWILTQSLNFYKILILNDEHTDRKYVQYFIIGWGVPGVIVFIFYIGAYLMYRFVLNLPEDNIYGDVHRNKDICFITEALAGLAGVIAPALLCVMMAGIVFIQAYQVAPQWRDYDDVYRGRQNLHEIRVLLLFWACICVTWLFGGLHLAYSHVWMLVLFCFFNILTGLFAFIAYAVLRNPCIPCLRPKNGLAYSLNASRSDLNDTLTFGHVPPSIAESKETMLFDNENWDNHSTTKSSQLKVKRNPATNMDAVAPAVYVLPRNSLSDMKTVPSYSSNTISSSLHSDSSKSSKDLDDLIFALKSRSVTDGEESQYDTDIQGHYSFQGRDEGQGQRRQRSVPSIGTYPHAVRRTKHSIVDTHF